MSRALDAGKLADVWQRALGPRPLALVGLAGLVLLLVALAGCARPDTDDRVIEVTVGRYHYTPGTETPIDVALGETVVLRITSTDVVHGFAIEGQNVDVEVPAGGTIDVRFTPTRAGDFRIFCTVFCGSGHPQHKGTLHVA